MADGGGRRDNIGPRTQSPGPGPLDVPYDYVIVLWQYRYLYKKSFYPPHSRPELNSGREDLKMQGEGCPKHVYLSDLWQDDDGQDEDEETR